ncbi:hypothetical protein [Stenotrophomonas phage c9-N]|nr:hypothetical protein [Stenotrophomonas phage c9-N]
MSDKMITKLPQDVDIVVEAKDLVPGKLYRSTLVPYDNAVIWFAVTNERGDVLLVSLKGASVIPPRLDKYVEVKLVRGLEVAR